MELRFSPRNIIEMDDVRICFRNFKGEERQFNAAGNRNFSIVIPNGEIAETLQNDLNRFGVGWNVKISAPREEGAEPFIHLPVKVKFNDKGPKVYLLSGHNRIRLTEETIGMLDDIDIAHIDLDIRPYDDEMHGRAFRTAYLQSMIVTQNLDRFEQRFAEEEAPEE